MRHIGRNVKIGDDVKIWHFTYVGDGTEIGEGTRIGSLPTSITESRLVSGVRLRARRMFRL
jgi:UDP-3-O-[3-hydroxymyristoyl] glucosamine N-acyltransferase